MSKNKGHPKIYRVYTSIDIDEKEEEEDIS